MFEKPLLPVIVAATILTAIAIFFMAFSLIMMRKRQSLKSKLQLQALLEERENTMDRISMEIHDHVNQMLNMAIIHLHGIEEKLLPEHRYLSHSLNDLLDNLIFDTQNIGHTLDPHYLKDIGFITSIMETANWLNATNRISCSVNIDGERKMLAEQTGLMAFRIAQEALNNCIKYAEAKAVTIDLIFGEADFELRINDNGKGMDTESTAHKKGSGIKNMQQRAAIVKGELKVRSKLGVGTSVVLRIPDVFLVPVNDNVSVL